jgi:methionyl-tRNA formyltransferase
MPHTSVIYFGTTGTFSAPPFRALLEAGNDVRAVVLSALDRAQPLRRVPVTKAPTRGRALPLLATHGDQNIVALATEHGIPVWEVGDLSASATRETLAGYSPDALCVACFARKLPASLLSLPHLGALNVHPSLLPDNRGPDPLFWTFWRGDEATGVTIHLMDERLDTGPILAQQGEPVPDGMAEAALEARLATLGGELLDRSLDALADGSAHPQPQDERQATTFPWPSTEDYTVTPAWSARRAYRFLTGIAHRFEPARIALDGATFVIHEALGYEAQARLDAPWRLEGDLLTARLSPGVLHARIRHQAGL